MKTNGCALAILLTTFAAQSHAGTARICMAPPSAQIPEVDTAQAVAGVREIFTGYLTGPSLSVMPLQAKLASQAREEARQKSCEYLLFTTVVQQSKTVTSGLVQRLAAGAISQGASQAAYEGKTSGARVAASAAAGGASNAHVATATKVKDTLTLTYRLENAQGQELAARSQKRKAGSAGEDLLTPLIESAAEDVANVVIKQGSP